MHSFRKHVAFIRALGMRNLFYPPNNSCVTINNSHLYDYPRFSSSKRFLPATIEPELHLEVSFFFDHPMQHRTPKPNKINVIHDLVVCVSLYCLPLHTNNTLSMEKIILIDTKYEHLSIYIFGLQTS